MTILTPQMTPQMTLAAIAPEFVQGPWRRVNGLAVVSLTLGVLQFLLPFVPTALVTIPVGVNALRQTDAARQRGRNLAIAGLTLSVAHSILYVVLFCWLIVAG